MAFAATGPFTHPDPEQDETYPNAYFAIVEVHLTRGANPFDGSARFEVYKNQAAKNTGKRARFSNTFPFNYSANGGSAYAQAQVALKALPEYPGLIDA
jgi:hypothetical protein